MQNATKKDANSNIVGHGDGSFVLLPALDRKNIIVLEPVPGSFLAQLPLIWGVVHELDEIPIESRCGRKPALLGHTVHGIITLLHEFAGLLDPDKVYIIHRWQIDAVTEDAS